MNITTNEAGCVSQKHIIDSGFSVYEEHEMNDMGQATYTFPQYKREDGLKLTGGFWEYNLKNVNDEILFTGWWNSNKEFDETMKKFPNEKSK